MAEIESKIILNAETGQAVRNIAELREVINKYKADLADTGQSYEQNRATVDKLAQAQAVLRDAMNGTGKASVENAKIINLEKSSYNDLVKAMAVLTKEWRATSDEAERAKLGYKINEINSRLKELDASKGTFVRNVGDYYGQMKSLFGGVISGIKGTIPAVGGLNKAFSMLSVNPFVAVAGALVTVIKQIGDGIKSSEANTEGLTRAFSAFSVVGDAVQKVFQGLGAAITAVAQGVTSLVGVLAKAVPALEGVNKKMQERQELAKMQIEYDKRERENIRLNAEAEREIARLRAEASETDKYNAEERLKRLESANELQLEIAKREQEQAKANYEIIKLKNSFTESTKEQKKAEEEAYAEMIGAETRYFNQSRELTKQIATLRAKTSAEAVEAEKKKNAEVLREREELQKELVEIDAEIEASFEEALSEEVGKDSKTSERARVELEEKIAGLQKQAEAQKEWNEILAGNERERAEKEYEINRELQQRKLDLLGQYAEEAYRRGDVDSYLQLVQERGDLEIEIEMEVARREKEINEQKLADKAELVNNSVGLFQNMLGSISSITSELASQYEKDTEATEAELKKAKNLKITSATIDMLGGIVAGWASAMSLPFPFNLAMGALTTATTATLGAVNIAKIKSQDVSRNKAGGGSVSTTSGAGVSVNAPSVTRDLPTYRMATSASEEERLNQMASSQKVYLVTSELEAKQNDQRVRVQESEF